MTAERRRYRPSAVFDVRDHFREQRNADGLAATVTGPVRFTVRAVVAPGGRTEPDRWALDTRRTAAGLSVFLDRVLDAGPPRVARRLLPAATSVEVRVSSAGFQPADVAFRPGDGSRTRIDLAPDVTYPFDRIAHAPGDPGPVLLRGTVLDERGRGVPGAVVSSPGAPYDYRTGRDGAWVLVLPGPRDTADITVTPPRAAEVLADPWTGTVPARRGGSVPVPALRLRPT